MFFVKFAFYITCFLAISCGRGRHFFDAPEKRRSQSSSDALSSYPPDLTFPSLDDDGFLRIQHHTIERWGGERFLGSRKLALMALESLGH